MHVCVQMVETHFPVARINNSNLSVDKLASQDQMLSVSGTSTSRRVTMSVRHAMKLLVTIIDSRRINAHRSREIRVQLNYFVTRIPRSVQVTPLDTFAMHTRSAAPAPRQSCLIISPWPRPFVEHTYFSHSQLCLNTYLPLSRCLLQRILHTRT